nr:hypothetical protein [uncultured Acetatifactor sp.]
MIQDSLEKMKNIGTMLIVAHRLSTIQYADNIILLSHGRIVEQGSHQQLLHQRGGIMTFIPCNIISSSFRIPECGERAL